MSGLGMSCRTRRNVEARDFEGFPRFQTATHPCRWGGLYLETLLTESFFSPFAFAIRIQPKVTFVTLIFTPFVG